MNGGLTEVEVEGLMVVDLKGLTGIGMENMVAG